ncbi:MAG: MerR family transcriptional regulator [Bacteroidia bacterium]|nr:MerR family transcriptional regulator [Bacteroidota bacterium]MBP9083982.1 MerR family transcriptional regulator [Bacteroidia bacterium]MBK7391378.1 MerR family transcriptional regulator [Bacteroidota bacterium]MBK7967555.1 MerR family transcriptional regulator [Bacteroidota bacterium]MBK8413718.1 MerR family transcriptional regulator [Bacteroidota bacterium]
MPYKESDTVKLYYTIGEVAAMFKVNASLIRFWEKEFDVLQPKKNKKGNRLFTATDVENLRIIFHLVKERGFTLQGAKSKLKENKSDVVDTAEIYDALVKVRGFLTELKENL